MGEAVDGEVGAGAIAGRYPQREPRSARLGPEEIRHWAYRCVDGLTDRCDEINELNVFPIPDSDTGTNLVFTVRAAVESMRNAGPDADLPTLTSALARGATAGARGNSGVIISQVMRALAEEAASGELDGPAVSRLLRRASTLVGEVISVPVDGTIVTVLSDAACAGEAVAAVDSVDAAHDLAEIVTSAAEAAAAALERTRTQLPVLEAAGVVDAGGLGLLVMLDALCYVTTGWAPDRPHYHRTVVSRRRPRSPAPRGGGASAEAAMSSVDALFGYEVLYRITSIEEGDVAFLRDSLSELGDSVVVAGDGAGTWSAHVHTVNAGLAVEVGLGIGRIHDVRIHAFAAYHECDVSNSEPDGAEDAKDVEVASRDILAVVAGDGAEKLYSGEGAAVLRCDTTRIGTSELCAAIVASEHAVVLVLPNGALSAHDLVSVSIASRTAGKDVLMLPSSSMVQGLAALAVHDPSREAVDDAFAMSEAAAGTRWASLRVADERSLTWVGMCEPGNGLGLVGREVVVIGPDVFTAGCNLLDQLLSVGGEMITMLRGEYDKSAPHDDASGPDELDVVELDVVELDVVGRLAEYVAARHPEVEVVLYDGGQPGDVVQLGVE